MEPATRLNYSAVVSVQHSAGRLHIKHTPLTRCLRCCEILTLQPVVAGAGALKHQYETKINIEVCFKVVTLASYVCYRFRVVFGHVLNKHINAVYTHRHMPIHMYNFCRCAPAPALHAVFVAPISGTLRRH
jgi:hypothetical protein